MFQAFNGGMNLFDWFLERVGKRIRYKEFNEKLAEIRDKRCGGKRGTRISMAKLLR